MKVLIPFWDLRIFDRYIPQFRALTYDFEITILYRYGTPLPEWEPWFTFITYDWQDWGHKYFTWWMNQEYVSSFIPLDFDLVYSLSGLWMNIYGRRIAEALDIPHVIRMRGDMIETRRHQKRSSAQRYLFSRAMNEAFRSATLIVPIVDKFRNTLISIGIDESQIYKSVPNGIKLSDWTLNHITYEELVPGYAGRISPEKGSQFLLSLIKATPQYKWVLTGDIQDPNFILPGNAMYLGKTRYEDMDEFYDLVSVLVNPSHTEGFPNVLLEFYAKNKPVIVSPDFLPKEVQCYGQVCDLVLDQWIDALLDIWTLYDSYCNGAREYAKMFSWEKYRIDMAGAFDTAILNYGGSGYRGGNRN